MSIEIKGFGRLIGFTANNPSSTIGEVDDKVATFSLVERSYKSQLYPTGELITFSAIASSTNEEVSLNTDLRNYLLKLVAYINDSVDAHSFNNSTQSAKSFILNSTAIFGPEFVLNKVGAMASSGNYYCPSYLDFNLVGDDLESHCTIWFSKSAFTQQYPLYTIYPISGIPAFDDLHSSDDNITATLLKVNPTVMTDLEQAKIGDYPNTAVVSMNYKVYSDEGVVLGVIYLSAIIYGPAGNNPDIIRDTFVDWILDNSTYDRDAWEKRIPDLFIKTEYILVPMWTEYGVPNNGTSGAMYRSIVKTAPANALLVTYNPTITRTHIENYGCVGVGRYKSIMFAAIGATTNRHGIYSLDEQWPLFGNMATTSEDYNRYDEDTKEFITRLVTLLKYAENVDDYISFEAGYSKVTRDGNVFMSTTLNNIQYLLLTKKSMVGEEEE